MRNCNPLNIRKNDNDKWLGLSKEQTDSSFFKFENIFYGLRAAFKVLSTYNTKYKLYSVSAIINRWAPPTENNTSNYIKMVCDLAMLREDEYVIIEKEKNKAKRLVFAMAYIESQELLAVDVLDLSYRMAFNK